MNSKIKKIMLLTTGLAGGLIATSVAGITLSSCTFQVQQDPNNSNNQGSSGNNNSSNQTTSPKDELTYNPNANYYTTQIVFDQFGNITNASASTLTMDGGLIFADPAKTTLIGIMPGFEQSQVTIPSTVKAITGYQAAVVYNNASGKIVNPTFEAGTGLKIDSSTQTLLNLGAVGAFQKLGTIVDGSVAGGAGGAVTPPSLTAGTTTGLDFVTSIQFQNGSQLQSIGPKAFAGCNNLTTVKLPDTCNTIGATAFQNCTNLQTINLKGVQYIGDSAFNNAFIASTNAIATSNKVSLDLSSAQYIGTGAFDSSTWTTNTRVAGESRTTQVLPGTPTATETAHLSKISAVTFGSQLNNLKPYAFNGANYLESADLSNCTNLATISNDAFRNTQNLTSVKFSNTIDTIGENAFSGATALTSANFPSGLQTIGNSAFSNAPLAGSFNPESTTLNIGQNAFDGSAFETIDFSKVVGNLTIGNSAFANNTTLKSITWAKNEELQPGSQLQIKSQAFDGCTKLGKGDAGTAPSPWTLPNNLTLLANGAFPSSITFNSTYTNAINISSDTLMSNNAFGGKWDLSPEGTTVEGTDTIALGPQLFANNQNVTSIDLSGSNIQALGWTNTEDLQDVFGSPNFTIPTGSGTNTSPQLGTFANCTSLQTLTLPATCSQFGAGFQNYYWSSPFANCKSLANINYNGFDLTPVSEGANAVTAGFDQMNRNTWTQVANIMNAFGYVGQQTISTTGVVTADPSTNQGTWASSSGLASKSGITTLGMFNLFADGGSGQSWVNQPINVYGAGSYQYKTTAAPEDPAEQESRAATTPVTVSYSAGLGYSTAATTGSTNATLEQPESDENANYLQVTGSTLNDNTTIQVPKTIVGSSETINATDTITISGNRPLSVWYTVGQQAEANPANNIYIPTENKLVGTTNGINGNSNSGNGGIGWTSTAFQEVTQRPNGNNLSGVGTPFKLAQPESDSPTQKFYTLPLGITESTNTAYFNHNGVIWQYKKNTADGSITITGTVNYYIGGAIQSQDSGANDTNSLLQNQTSNNGGTGLTLVNSIKATNTGLDSSSTFVGLDGTTSDSALSSNSLGLFLFSQNGGVDGSTPISQTVGPKGLTVTLTLVPPTNSGN